MEIQRYKEAQELIRQTELKIKDLLLDIADEHEIIFPLIILKLKTIPDMISKYEEEENQRLYNYKIL